MKEKSMAKKKTTKKEKGYPIWESKKQQLEDLVRIELGVIQIRGGYTEKEMIDSVEYYLKCKKSRM
jgi:hypothetical protein